jgi:aspartyl aminopeptidase
MNTCEKLLRFLDACPTAYHAAAYFKGILKEHGYTELMENQPWELRKGGCYFVSRNSSSLIAFRIPESNAHGFMISASHTDSPALKLKPSPELQREGLVQLNVEGYGSLLCAPWFDRPLTIAGRVLVREKDSVIQKLLYIDRDLLMIPSLAIHMDRQFNQGHTYNIQKEMCPLFRDENGSTDFITLIAEETGTAKEDILSYDLYAVPRTKGTCFGAENEFICAPHLDDLECAFAGMEGFLTAAPAQVIAMICLFDNEEVGSRSRQGADSTFLSDTMLRLRECLSLSGNEYLGMLADSFLLSADNAHAVHPSWPEKADPCCRPKMNGGIVIKHAANQLYTTDAVSAAIVKQLARNAAVPVQEFANRSDMIGGSTLGNISNSHISLKTADIGLAQLAMHSPCETAGAKDVEYLVKLSRALFESALETGPNGSIRICSARF